MSLSIVPQTGNESTKYCSSTMLMLSVEIRVENLFHYAKDPSSFLIWGTIDFSMKVLNIWINFFSADSIFLISIARNIYILLDKELNIKKYAVCIEASKYQDKEDEKIIIYDRRKAKKEKQSKVIFLMGLQQREKGGKCIMDYV